MIINQKMMISHWNLGDLSDNPTQKKRNSDGNSAAVHVVGANDSTGRSGVQVRSLHHVHPDPNSF